jgi:hypothetical protein
VTGYSYWWRSVQTVVGVCPHIIKGSSKHQGTAASLTCQRKGKWHDRSTSSQAYSSIPSTAGMCCTYGMRTPGSLTQLPPPSPLSVYGWCVCHEQRKPRGAVHVYNTICDNALNPHQAVTSLPAASVQGQPPQANPLPESLPYYILSPLMCITGYTHTINSLAGAAHTTCLACKGRMTLLACFACQVLSNFMT